MFGYLGITVAVLAGVAAAQPVAAFTSNRVIITAQGAGPDVILVPGLTSSPRIYSAMVAALPGYRYHLVQVRGFSGTAAGANTQGDVSAMVAEELVRYIGEARLKKPALIGHSMGGTIGMMIASRHPDALGKLMVVDMAPFTGAFFGASNAAEARTIMERMQKQMSANPEASRAMNTQMITGMVNNEAERPAVLNDSQTSDPAVVARTFADIQATDLRDELKSVRVPVTVLYVKPAMAATVPDEAFDGNYRTQYAKLSGVKLIRVADSAHFIMLDAPLRFRAEVDAFLSEQVSQGRQ